MTDLILGIETSCDDTSVALVSRDGTVLACETRAQYSVHAAYGGVFPELASRAHLEAILPVVQEVLQRIDGDISRICAIGVTRGPGLIGSLLVGVNTAQALGAAWGKPVIGVNHLRGHLRSPALDGQSELFPAVLLLASGGHTLVAHQAAPGQIEVLGSTRDDSIGESYDKVARMLGLGMPGGPAIDALAAQGEARYRLPRPMKNEGYEFSFSGLKSSVARLLEREPEAAPADVAASFVAACLDVIRAKLDRAIEARAPRSVVVVGGVSASAQLRDMITELAAHHGIAASLPPRAWATDNAAMIALAAWDYLDQGMETDLRARPNLAFDAW